MPSGSRNLRYSGPGVVTDEAEKRRLALEDTQSPAYLPLPESPTPVPDPLDPTVFAGVATDPRPEFDAARAAADEDRKAATVWGGVSEVNAALGGLKAPNYRAADAMRADAASKEADAQKNLELGQIAAKARAFNEANDPNSASNARAREIIARAMPAFAGKLGPAYATMTQAQLEKAFGVANKASDQDFRDRQLEETNRHNQAMEGRVSFGAGASAGISERFGARNIMDFSKATKALAPLVATMDQVEALAPGTIRGKVDPNNTVSALDRIMLNRTKGIGSRMLANPAATAQLDSGMKLVKELYAKGVLQVGANFTPAEMERLDAVFRDSNLAADPEMQAASLDLIRRAIGRQVKMMEGAPKTITEQVSPGLWGKAVQNGMLDSSHPLFQDAAPAAGPAAAARTVSRKQYSPSSNKTKITYSDGTSEVVDGRP